MAAAAAAVPEDLKKKEQTLEDQVFMIEIMMDAFEKYLDPSLVIDYIFLPGMVTHFLYSRFTDSPDPSQK